MGLRFRKSVNFGPLRVNFSKSGVGYSVGGKGFRVTKKATGGYRTTASIPGTGISHVQDFKEPPKTERSADSVTENNKRRVPVGIKLALGGVILLFVLIMLFGCSSDEPKTNTNQTDISTVQPSMEDFIQSEPAPELAPAPEIEPEPAPDPEPVVSPEEQTIAYIGNSNSLKFHELSCGSVQDMSEKNKVNLYGRDEAISRGYEPCGRCKP